MSRRKKWRIRSVAAVLISLPLLLSGCQKTESILAGMGGEKGYERPEIMIAAMSQKNTCEELCTGQIWSVPDTEYSHCMASYGNLARRSIKFPFMGNLFWNLAVIRKIHFETMAGTASRLDTAWLYMSARPVGVGIVCI